MNIEAFPEPEDIKNKDEKYTTGMNKSGRSWKVGVNRKPNKNWANKGAKLTWEEKQKRKKEMEQIRSQIKQFKEKKIEKRKENKQRAKQRKRQR